MYLSLSMTRFPHVHEICPLLSLADMEPVKQQYSWPFIQLVLGAPAQAAEPTKQLESSVRCRDKQYQQNSG